jgi:curli biogenesis system outer membrane secretion channel CsgG
MLVKSSRKRVRRALYGAGATALLAATLGPRPAAAQMRQPRVAVIELRDASAPAYRWGGQGTTAAAVTDMLVNELTRVGRFSVVERTQLASLLKEHRLAITGVLDPKTAAQFGRVLGIDALILGSVTHASVSERKVGVGAASVTRVYAEIWLDVRLVSAKTAEIVVAITEKGDTNSFAGRARTKEVGDAELANDNASNLMFNASREAVQRVAKAFAEQAGRIEMVAPAAWQAGLVRRGEKVFVQNGFVFVDAGVVKGVQVGERLEVVRVDKSISIPIPEVIAIVEVVDNMVADGQASKCRFLYGAVNGLHLDDAVRRASVPKPVK